MLFQQLAHVHLPEGDGDPINASFNPSPEIICLERILRAKFTSPLGDYDMSISAIGEWYILKTYSPAADYQ